LTDRKIVNNQARWPISARRLQLRTRPRHCTWKICFNWWI